MAKPIDPLGVMLARRQITPAQHAAAKRLRQLQARGEAEILARCRAALGSVGMELLELVLGLGMSLTAIAAARGDSSNKELVYLGRRLRECLDMLAEVFAQPTLRQRGLRFRNSPANAHAAAFVASTSLPLRPSRSASRAKHSHWSSKAS